MKAIKALLSLLVCAASIAFVTRMVLPKLECNRAKGIVNRSLARLWDSGREFERIDVARRNVEMCRKCIARYPQDHHWYYLLGLNLDILDDREEAIRNLEYSLTLADRPEVYGRLAVMQVEAGNVEAARAALLKASTFQIGYADLVAPPMRIEVQHEVLERYTRLTGKPRP